MLTQIYEISSPDEARRLGDRNCGVPITLAGGLGPDNVAKAISVVGPAGEDSKTRTDKEGTHAKDLARVRYSMKLHEPPGAISRPTLPSLLPR